MVPPVDLELPHDVETRLAAIGSVDVVVGVLTYEHGRTVAGVIQGIEKSLRAGLPDARAMLVQSDAGSTDDTVAVGAAAATELPVVQLRHSAPAAQRAAPPSNGVPGADRGLRTIARIGAHMGARAALLVGADLRTVPEEWLERLLAPVWAGELDFVAPLFARHPLDGTLTSCLLYPLTRVLYGGSVRHLVATEVALSAALLGRVAEGAGWGTQATRSLPLHLGISATALGARLGEAWLGPRPEVGREARIDLGTLMSEVVGTAFALVELHEDRWREGAATAAPRRIGVAPTPVAAPAQNPAPLTRVFRQGVRDLGPIWEQVLAAETLAGLYSLVDLGPEDFVFTPDLWARVVYEFLLAFRFRVLHRDHLLRSLVPLYLGRIGALMREAAGLTAAGQEGLLERQAEAFERARPDLVDRWR